MKGIQQAIQQVLHSKQPCKSFVPTLKYNPQDCTFINMIMIIY